MTTLPCLLALVVFVLACGARTEAAPRGLYLLSQSVNSTNSPNGPAQLLLLDAKTGQVRVVGPVNEDGSTPLVFSSVTGWPFYAGGAARGGQTYAVLLRPDGQPVLATIDLSTGKAIHTLPLNDVGSIFGLFQIGAVGGQPYGAVLRPRGSLDVGPFLSNGSVARHTTVPHFVLISIGMAGGPYFGFFQQNMGHEWIDTSSNKWLSVIGNNQCWFKSKWARMSVGVTRGTAGFVDPATGNPYVLVLHENDNNSQVVSLARLNDTGPAGGSIYCKIEWMSDVVSNSPSSTITGNAAHDQTTNTFHTVVWDQNNYVLASVDLSSGRVHHVKIALPAPPFRGAIRQMLYHLG